MKYLIILAAIFAGTQSQAQIWKQIPVRVCSCIQSSSDYNVDLILKIMDLAGNVTHSETITRFPFNGYSDDRDRALNDCREESRNQSICRFPF